MSGLHSLMPQEKNALAILADAVDRCREEDMRTPEVLASLDLLARRTLPRWPFEQFKESLNFAIGDRLISTSALCQDRLLSVKRAIRLRGTCTPLNCSFSGTLFRHYRRTKMELGRRVSFPRGFQGGRASRTTLRIG
jgi:hypothetical protein